jgi:hypothetical protein
MSNRISARMQHEMIRVAKHELQAKLVNQFTIKPFERRISSDRDKIRGLDNPVGRMNEPDACA